MFKTTYIIAKEIINLAKRKGLHHNSKLVELANRLGFGQLENNFDCIYAHTLVKYSEDKMPNELVLLFGCEEVKEAFNKDFHHKESVQLEPLIQAQLHTNRELHCLKQAYPNVSHLEEEIALFRKIFEMFMLQASNPMMLKMYNDMQAELRKKSFSYQSEQYIKTLRDKFKTDFLDKGEGFYVDTYGEIRRYRDVHTKLHDLDFKQGDMEEDRKKYEATTYRPLDKYLNEWLGNDSQKLLVILGEYGTGKTTFMEYLAHQLSSQRLGVLGEPLKISDPKNRLPLLLPLRNFEKKLDTFVTNHCNKVGIEDVNFASFQERVQAGELLLLLDGFDEMTHNIDSDEKRKNFAKLQQLIDLPNCKAILTCREEYFKSRQDMEKVFKHPQNTDYQVLHLLPFENEQIQQYLRSHKPDEADKLWAQIEKIDGLRDLSQRPVLLQLIIDHLPNALKRLKAGEQLNASDLYASFMEDELQRKEKDMRFHVPSKYRLPILEKLAVWMYKNDTLSFDTRLIEKELNLRQYFQVTEEWKYEKRLNEFLTFTFLIRDAAAYQYRISHKSFRDYLTACVFVREINERKIVDFAAAKTSKEVNRFIREQEPNQQYLLDLITSAKNLPEERQWQGTNAANILLNIGEQALLEGFFSIFLLKNRTILAGENLANCQLQEVNFTECDLTDTVFHKTNLRKCSFSKSILDAYVKDCNFEEATLSVSSTKLTDKDLEKIKDWKGISELALWNNQITDIQPINQLTNLTKLYLINSEVKHIQLIKNLNKLEVLNLSKNQITNIQAIKNFNNLTALSLYNNQITDIQPINQLTNLTRLSLDGNQIKKIQPITQLINLTELHLHNNQITDIQPINQLTNLTRLSLGGNRIKKIQPITQLINLTELLLHNNNITDIQPINQLINLTELYLHNNNITNIQPINQLTNLTRLSLGSNQIKNMQLINQLTNLTELLLYNSNLTDIQSINQLTNLTRLILSHNRITNITPLTQLQNLEELWINHSPITDFQPLLELPKLNELHIDATQLTSSFKQLLLEKLPDLEIIVE